MTNSNGHIEKIEDKKAFGVFTSGPRKDSTFDLPITYTLDKDKFDIVVGAEVTFIPDSGKNDDRFSNSYNSYIVISGEKALVLHVTDDGMIQEGDIIKRLH